MSVYTVYACTRTRTHTHEHGKPHIVTVVSLDEPRTGCSSRFIFCSLYTSPSREHAETKESPPGTLATRRGGGGRARSRGGRWSRRLRSHRISGRGVTLPEPTAAGPSRRDAVAGPARGVGGVPGGAGEGLGRGWPCAGPRGLAELFRRNAAFP